MTIDKEDIARLRYIAEDGIIQGVNKNWQGSEVLRILDALEAAEARAEAAERERGALIGHILGYKVVNPDCPRDMGHSCALNHGHSEFDSIVCERETIEEIRQCWLEWACQQARGGENE